MAPGITWPLAPFKDRDERTTLGTDSLFTATYSGKGALGLYLEAGWFHATQSGFESPGPGEISDVLRFRGLLTTSQKRTGGLL